MRSLLIGSTFSINESFKEIRICENPLYGIEKFLSKTYPKLEGAH
jgi:hypothetical protein